MKRSVIGGVLAVNVVFIGGGIALLHTNNVRREAEEKKAIAQSERFIQGAIKLGSTLSKQELMDGERFRFRLMRDNALSSAEFADLMSLIERDLASTSQGVSFITLISGFRGKPKLSDAQRKKLGTVCVRVAKGGYSKDRRVVTLAMIKINRLTEFYPELQALRQDQDKEIAEMADAIVTGKPTAKVVRQ